MKFTADYLLSIPLSNPEALFDKNSVKSLFRKLAKKWHPDVNKSRDAVAVFAHISRLYDEAIYRLQNDIWNKKGVFEFIDIKNKTYRVKYKYTYDIDIGTMYVSDTYVIYVINKKFEHLFLNGQNVIKNLKFSSDRMKKEVGCYLPNIAHILETEEEFVLLFSKTRDQVPLRALLTYFNGKLDPKHVAWIISSVYSIVCYLKWADLVHHDISLDTCFVSPEFHSVSLLGGWWYTKPYNSSLKAVPSRTYRLLPLSVKDSKKASFMTDTQLIKALGRELFDDVSGTMLRTRSDIPGAMVDWCLLPGTDNVFNDYDNWMNKVLVDSYGERRFVKLDVVIDDIYQSLR